MQLREAVLALSTLRFSAVWDIWVFLLRHTSNALVAGLPTRWAIEHPPTELSLSDLTPIGLPTYL